ncbi:protein Red-like, partial [Dendronephthya gigantea]|uniref:protein Red-like n=1 Tax=Dendronephthya gigantea TaxID=151771 RepID=UPI001068DF02
MPEGTEVFSNPYAPSGSTMGMDSMEDEGPALTNDDFRKLLMTPRAAAPDVAPPSASVAKLKAQSKVYNEHENPASLRRKRKSHYAKLKKIEEEREKELAAKYRDRARERRDGFNPDYQGTDVNLKASGDYKAVGPTVEATNTAAEMRKRAIQESKFLGGDMEHTHLVKGLDFALLQKVRSEITAQEYTDEDLMKKGKHKPKNEKSKQIEEIEDDDDSDEDDEMEFSTVMGQKIYKSIFKSRPADKNELFQPGRMAYVFELEDEYAESDIPTTLIRSKADCPGMEAQTTLTTNDIVINKLTQILSYLRQGMRGKKMKKKERGKNKAGMDDPNDQRYRGKVQGLDSIYEDIAEYNPDHNSRDIKKSKDVKKDKHNYFEKPVHGERNVDDSRKPEISAKDFAKSVTKQFSDK